MDFEEAWEHIVDIGYSTAKQAAKLAWEAATKAEREACAKVCEALCDDDNEYGYDECDGGAEAAARIRMRSNAKLSRGGTGHD